ELRMPGGKPSRSLGFVQAQLPHRLCPACRAQWGGLKKIEGITLRLALPHRRFCRHYLNTVPERDRTLQIPSLRKFGKEAHRCTRDRHAVEYACHGPR